jgi:hypothetical protein
VALLALLSWPVAADAVDRVYRCADGTFTNRPERRCAPYEPSGVVSVLPEGETLRSAKARIAKKRPICRRPPAPPTAHDAETAAPACL